MRVHRFRGRLLAVDPPPSSAPADAWTAAEGAVLRDGSMAEYRGAERPYEPTWLGVPEWVLWAQSVPGFAATAKAPQGYWFACRRISGAGIRIQQYGDTLSIPTADRTPASWAGAALTVNAGTGGVINGFAFVNICGLADSLAYGQINGSGALTQFVPSAGDSFVAVRPYRYQVVGLGLNSFPYRVSWTSSAAPGSWPATWAPAATNDAGSVDIDGAKGRLVDGCRLGDDFVVYAESSTHLMTYVGGSEVMAFRGLSGQSGVMSRNCIADIGGAHVVLTREDVVLVQSAGVRSIAAGRVRRLLFGPAGVVDGGLREQCFVWYDRARKSVYVAYPGDGLTGRGCSHALVWDVESGEWSGPIDIRASLAGGAATARMTHATEGASTLTALQQPGEYVSVCAFGAAAPAADTDGTARLLDEPGEFAGTLFYRRSPLRLERAEIDFDAPGEWKRIHAIAPRWRQSAAGALPITIRLYGQDAPDAARVQLAQVQLGSDAVGRVTPPIRTRLLTVEFTTPAAPGATLGPFAQLEGFDIHYSPAGGR